MILDIMFCFAATTAFHCVIDFLFPTFQPVRLGRWLTRGAINRRHCRGENALTRPGFAGPPSPAQAAVEGI